MQITYGEIVNIIEHVIEDNERLIAAGVDRNDPKTWRPDLIRPLPVKRN
jgi:hypothetical protein